MPKRDRQPKVREFFVVVALCLVGVACESDQPEESPLTTGVDVPVVEAAGMAERRPALLLEVDAGAVRLSTQPLVRRWRGAIRQEEKGEGWWEAIWGEDRLWRAVEEVGGSVEEGRVERLVELEEGEVDASQVRGGAEGLEITPVLEGLNDAVERVKKVDKLLRLEWEPRVAIALDGEVRFRTLVQLLYTVGQAGLSEYDLWGRGPSGESGAVRIVAPMIGARRTGSPPVRLERCVRPAVHLLEEGVRVGLQAGRRPHIKQPDYPSPSIAKPVGDQREESRPSWDGKVLTGAEGGCPTVDGTSLDQIRRIRERIDGVDFAPICRDGTVSADSSVAYRGLLRLLAGLEAREDLEMTIGMLKGGEKTGSECPPTTDGQLAGD